MKKRILVIEDETKIARVLKMELEYEGYEVLLQYSGKSGLETALKEDIDLILLDVMLPELNGIEVLRRLRKTNSQLPVIMLSARDSTFDKVNGLDHGANDYITKPFEIEELLARVRSCLRHYSVKTVEENPELISVRDLTINPDTREVKRGQKSIVLTPKEYDLLIYLATNKNKIVSRDNILLNVWGYEYEGETNTLDVFIRHLRKKLDEDFSSQLIHTVRGIGYTIKEK